MRFLPAAAIMALIFALSAQPDPGPDLGSLQLVASKLAHLLLYGALWTALAWALRFERPVLAFALTVLYGASDEIHQTFVEGRTGTPIDVAIDGAGAALAWWVVSASARPAGTPSARRRRRPARTRR